MDQAAWRTTRLQPEPRPAPLPLGAVLLALPLLVLGFVALLLGFLPPLLFGLLLIVIVGSAFRGGS
jgi:hypothetical protein